MQNHVKPVDTVIETDRIGERELHINPYMNDFLIFSLKNMNVISYGVGITGKWKIIIIKNNDICIRISARKIFHFISVGLGSSLRYAFRLKSICM